MDIQKLIEYISFSRASIYRMVQNDEIPYLRIKDKTLRFDKVAIDNWMLGHNPYEKLSDFPDFD